MEVGADGMLKVKERELKFTLMTIPTQKGYDFGVIW